LFKKNGNLADFFLCSAFSLFKKICIHVYHALKTLEILECKNKEKRAGQKRNWIKRNSKKLPSTFENFSFFKIQQIFKSLGQLFCT